MPADSDLLLEGVPSDRTPKYSLLKGGEASARWKAYYVESATTVEARIHGLAVVAALLGHASASTATAHYGRPRPDEGGSSQFSVPVATPAEVARVRQRLHLNLQRLATRPQPQDYQP